MLLSLYRQSSNDVCTQGKLFSDDDFIAFTLELPIKDGLPGSAIPAGEYPIELQPSPDFQRIAAVDDWFKPYCDAMPHIICPPRSYIMLHTGNTPSETRGCVLVGETQGINVIGTSRPAFEKLYVLIKSAIDSSEVCFLQVFDPPAQ